MRAKTTAVIRVALLNACILISVLFCACSFDRAKQSDSEENTDRGRAVYGEQPASTVPPASAPQATPQATADAAPVEPEAEEEVTTGSTRARAELREGEPEPAAVVQQRQEAKASVGGTVVEDPGNVRSGSPARNSVGSTSAAGAVYQPKGTVVGDPGERSGLAVGKGTPPRVPSNIIPALIRRWADTLASGNLGAHMALYSSRLSRFDGTVNISREVVRQRKQQTLADLRGARNLQLRDLRIVHPAGSELASATFVTEWTEGGRKKSERYRLTFRRSNGNWLIHSEEHL